MNHDPPPSFRSSDATHRRASTRGSSFASSASADLERQLAEMARLARCDPLTGLLNRRGLDATRQILAARAARTNMTFAFVAIDLDDFKAVNDQHGHGTGDLVLQEFAVRLTACCRSEDVRVRLGGDEFLLLLPEMNAAAACQLVERVRALQLREHLVTECVGTVPITREVWKPRRSSAD